MARAARSDARSGCELWPNLVFLKNGVVVRQLARPGVAELHEAFEELTRLT